MPHLTPIFTPKGMGDVCTCPPTVIGGGFVLGSEATLNLENSTEDNLIIEGIGNISVLLLTTEGDLDVTITSLVPPLDEDGNPINGSLLFVWNIDPTNTITLPHDDAGGDPEWRFYLPGEIDLVLGQNNGGILRWTQSLNAGVGGWLKI